MRARITVRLDWVRGSAESIKYFKAAIVKGLEKFTPDQLKPIDFKLSVVHEG